MGNVVLRQKSAHDLLIRTEAGEEVWEVPHSADSRYDSHNYYRFIGKFPPQLGREFLRRYATPGQVILDPMCGGGTTLIEAKRAGFYAVGYDINPVAVLVSRVATTSIPPAELTRHIVEAKDHLEENITGQRRLWKAHTKKGKAPRVPGLFGNEAYFSAGTLAHLSTIKSYIDALREREVKDFFLVAFLSMLRHVSRANVKKMNTEIDEAKKEKPVLPTFFEKLHKMQRANEAVASWPNTKISIEQNDSRSLPLDEGAVGLAVLHPPYLTNTAFSESVQLPLAWLGVKHTSVWKRELRCRGSFLHEPDGLRKYLVDWHRVMKEVHRVLQPRSACVIVIGDGQIDYVRIPVAKITEEFARDLGFEVVTTIRHQINNNTGMTLSHKMKDQRIIVLRK